MFNEVEKKIQGHLLKKLQIIQDFSIIGIYIYVCGIILFSIINCQSLHALMIP